MTTPIHVFLATDDDFIVHSATVMASILSNASLDDKLTFHVCSGKDLSADNKLKLEEMKALWNFDLNFPVPELNWEEPFRTVRMPPHINMNGFLRILIPWLCPDVLRVIYLDSDVIVKTSLAELNDTNIGDCYFAGVESALWAQERKRVGYLEGSYINTGVLLVNCDDIRCNEQDYWSRLAKGLDIKTRTYWTDQDMINDCFYDKIKIVSYKWNFCHTHYWNKNLNIVSKPEAPSYPTDPLDFEASRKNPAIIHYLAIIKPWTDLTNHPQKHIASHHPDRGLYFEYRAKTPWGVERLIESLGTGIKPAFPDKDGILVFFACDRNVPHLLNIALLSLVSNTKRNHYYDIVLLGSGLSELQKSEISSCGDTYGNISVRFIDMSQVERELNLGGRFYIHGGFTVASYWRTFAPYLFQHYDSAVYLDVDIIIEEDIFGLKQYNLGDNLIGACRDFAGMSCTCQASHRFLETVKLMSLRNVSDYFNGGVLLMNLAKMREVNFRDKLDNAYAIIRQPYFADQDILNLACRGQVTYLDPAWNYLEWPILIYKHNMEALPKDQYELYLKARSVRPKIIHYAGGMKPNHRRPDMDLSLPFWKYAKKSCYYEKFLCDMFSTVITESINSKINQAVKQISDQLTKQMTTHQSASHYFRPQRVLLYAADLVYKILAAVTPQSVKPLLRAPHQKVAGIWRKMKKYLE